MRRYRSWLLAVLLATPAAHAGAPHRGGTLRLVAASAAGTLDPQVNYTVEYQQIYALLYDGLVTFRKAGGLAGFSIVPDLAETLPKPEGNGTIYRFTLRSHIRFANGEPVTVAAVRHSFIRLFKVLSPNAGSWYSVIVGGRRCMASPGSCALPGLQVDPATSSVSFTLRHPDPAFLDQLAMPFASILPADTPDHDMGTAYIPGTGAYRVTSYNPATGMTLARNRYFKPWSAAAQPLGYPHAITYRFGLSPTAQVTGIENGQFDWMYNPIPIDRLGAVVSGYPHQIHVNHLLAICFTPLDTRIKPFDNVDARRAVAAAVDRGDIVKLFGGPAAATQACGFLQQGMPGAAKLCPSDAVPDLAKAQVLMKSSGMIGQPVTIVTQDQNPSRAIGVYLQSVLDALGLKASVKSLSFNLMPSYISNPRNNVQMSVVTWYPDYPRAGDVLDILFGCTSLHQGNANSSNFSQYCSPALQTKMDRASRLSLLHPHRSDRLWADIDAELVAQAPAIPLVNPRQINFTSARLRHFVHSDETFFIPDLAWLKRG
jgi:peptide/nickel transport system substrate-binding protein